uniref:Tudor domain protein n=1 Tax=Musca domestica TaxID=7370 RepID=T1P9D4_MUSDO
MLAGRSALSARLQQLQHPHLTQQQMHMAAVQHGNMRNIMMSGPVQPRMPQSIGNLRSMMQGIHLQNNRIPFTGLHYAQQAPPPHTAAAAAAHHHALVTAATTGGTYNGLPGVMPTSVPQFNVYNARYQRPPPPAHLQQQTLGAMNNGGGLTPSAVAPISPLSPPRRTTPATFKSNNLVVGQIYDVSISFVENGPFLFSVQLVTHQDDLTDMMNRIEKVELKPFNDKPLLGTACIARYSEDGQLYRALITGVQPMACKVAYIDYGNAEMVHYRDLYEIPEEFLKYKAFAIRFTLSGHKELEPIDDSLKKAFKDLVIYKNCKLKVMPLEGPPLVQYCELYMQEKNILHVLRQIQKTRLVYAKAEPLRNNDVVEIRYIDSPKNFYVQKVDNIPAFEKLMDDMFLYYNKNQNVPNHLALGAPCIVKYENEWYRAEVMRADATAIIVRHVDFGYEQKVTKNLLSTIAEKHLKLPRQAVQCCLKGFENNELSKDLATTQFEMLAEESNRERRSFTVKVFRIQPDGVNLVNLCTKDLNVMKKLYKLSMPFEQYLTLEKDDFNVHKLTAAHAENGHKTPSIASDVTSVHSSKKGQILNSTTVQSEELRMQNKQKQQQQHQQQQQSQYAQQQQRNNQSFQSSVSNSEWDKTSSHSSMAETRDSRSTSSDFRPNQQQQQQPQQQRKQYYKNYPNHKQQHQQQQQYQNQQQHSSNNSVASDKRSNASSYNNNKLMANNTPPRFQNKQKQQQQQQQLLAAQQSLQGLLSPGNSSSCSSTTQNNSHHQQYPLAMDCDPPLSTQQMPPPPPPQQQMRFGLGSSSLQGGGVTSTTSGPVGGSSSSSSSGGSVGSASSRLRQNSGSSGGSNSVFAKQHPQQSMVHSSSQQPPPLPPQGVTHHHNYAPASLPLDLVHHPLSAAASHLMMTDSSVITASASATGPAYSSWPSSGPNSHAFGMPPPPQPIQSSMVVGDMAPPPIPAHHLQQHHQMQQLQHSQRRNDSQGRLPAVSGTSSSSNSNSVGPGGGSSATGGSGGGSGSSASGDASSPMVGVCVQQSPVVIH